MRPGSLWEAAMALLNFRQRETTSPANGQVEAFLEGYSIEVMPRTAEKVEDFRELLPRGTRVYIAHIEGTPIKDMVATAKRLSREGYPVMPHFPARIIRGGRAGAASGRWRGHATWRFPFLHAASGVG
jgi:methylenetetrahydrofolate reductase (NADPH)